MLIQSSRPLDMLLCSHDLDIHIYDALMCSINVADRYRRGTSHVRRNQRRAWLLGREEKNQHPSFSDPPERREEVTDVLAFG